MQTKLCKQNYANKTMQTKRLLWAWGFICALIFTLSTTACGLTGQNTEATSTITISAAASLQNALTDIQVLYEQQQATDIIYNFGSSGSLMQQIFQGAPVDVFLSASEGWIDTLSQRSEIVEDSRKRLLKNSLVLVVSAEKSSINSFEDLIVDKAVKIAVGEPKSVPVGQYTQETLKSLGLLEQLTSQLVFGKNARQVLTYVETGNATAGIVYATDALASQRVSVIESVDSSLHSPIYYSAAIVQASQKRESAQNFIDFLSTPAAKEIFAESGFEAVQ